VNRRCSPSIAASIAALLSGITATAVAVAATATRREMSSFFSDHDRVEHQLRLARHAVGATAGDGPGLLGGADHMTSVRPPDDCGSNCAMNCRPASGLCAPVSTFQDFACSIPVFQSRQASADYNGGYLYSQPPPSSSASLSSSMTGAITAPTAHESQCHPGGQHSQTLLESHSGLAGINCGALGAANINNCGARMPPPQSLTAPVMYPWMSIVGRTRAPRILTIM